MARAVRIYFKKQIKVDHLSIPQYAMFKIGTVGLADVKRRVQAALNENDAPAKPLSKRYAIYKSKLGRGGGLGTNRRDLTLTGDMLRNYTVRTVSANKANASASSLKQRQKARMNQRRERWVAFSPQNRARVVAAAARIVSDMRPRLLLNKFFTS